MRALSQVWDESDAESSGRAETLTPLARPLHPEAQRLFDYWTFCEQNGGLVSGRDIPSRELTPILSNLMIYEPVEDGADFRIRLAGAAIRRRFGKEVTGKKLAQLFPESSYSAHCVTLNRIIEAGVADINDVRVPDSRGFGLHFERLGLPMWSSNRSVRWILCGLFFFAGNS